MKTQSEAKRFKLSETFSEAELSELRKLVHVEHTHVEGQNECRICDEPLLKAASREIIKLRTQRDVALVAQCELRAACKKALDWATWQGQYTKGRATVMTLAKEVAPALEAALMF